MRKSARDLLKSIARLRSTLDGHRPRLSRRLAERPAVAADPTGAFDPVFDHFDAELAVANRELTAAEHAYAVAEQRARKLGRDRQEEAAELHGRHAAVERFCRSQPGLRRVVLVGPTPEEPAALVQQAEQTVGFLRELEKAEDAPLLTPGFSLDAGAVAEELADGLPRLEAAMVALDHARSDVAYARDRANRAFAEAGEVASWVAAALVGISGLAGEEKLAAKIRGGRG